MFSIPFRYLLAFFISIDFPLFLSHVQTRQMPFLFQQGLFDEPEAVAGEAGKVEEFGPQNGGKTGEHLE